MSKFRPCKIDNHTKFLDNFCYIVDITFYNIDSKYFNNIISKSNCYEGDKIQSDNGRVIKAKELSMVITDVDFELIRKAYKYSYYIINKCYYAKKDYLPKIIVDFILEKYVDKTKLKNVEGKEVLYAITKASFNAIYGMCCTNNIRDLVEYNNKTGWNEKELSQEQIEKLLIKEKMFPFLSFAWGSFCTAYARRNLINNMLKLDESVIYCDTDSLKLKEGYNKSVIDNYNKSVIEKIKKVCSERDIEFEKFSPKDIKGNTHSLGIFENDGKYDKFITQGAKKYAYEIEGKIYITVSGVPKEGAKELKSLEEFTDNLIFNYENTGKNIIIYNDDQIKYNFRDCQGNIYRSYYRYGSCILPTTYELNKSQDYKALLSDNSSKRAIYKRSLKNE